jgi:hypothetical protein
LPTNWAPAAPDRNTTVPVFWAELAVVVVERDVGDG